jgi:hypothetical protein
MLRRPRTIRRICVECGGEFYVDASHSYARVCSKKCSNSNYKAKKAQKEDVNMNETTAVPKAVVGSEAVRMAHNNNAHRLHSQEERNERQKRIMDLRGQGYTYGEIAALVGCHVGTVGYWVLKAEGRPSPSKAVEAARGISRLTKKAPVMVTDFQREEVLEGMADALWSRLGVADKVRVLQSIREEEVL